MEMSCDRREVWRCHVTEERGMEMSCDSQEAWRCDRKKRGQPGRLLNSST